MTSDFIYEHELFRQEGDPDLCSACGKPKDDYRYRWCGKCRRDWKKEKVKAKEAGQKS